MVKKLFYLITLIFISLSVPAYPTEIEADINSVKDFPSPEMMTEMDKYDVTFYHIDLDVTNTSSFLSGSTIVNIVSKEDGLAVVWLQLSEKYTVSSIIVDNTEVSFQHIDDFLSITLPSQLESGHGTSLYINYSGQSKGEGIKSSKARKWKQTVLWTISEPSKAYKWFPVKQDLTDKVDSAYIFVTVPENLEAVSNGVLENITNMGNGKKRYEWVTRYPTAYYLLSIVVGDYTLYDLSDTIDGRRISIPNYVYNTPLCLEYYQSTIDYTPLLLELFSILLIPYPFAAEKYGQVMAPFPGGMEHQTITMLGFYSFGLIAHEMAHQWFGDYVTCSTWQDIWINEGFASYAEYLTYEMLTEGDVEKRWLDDAMKMAFREPNGSIFLTPENALNEKKVFSNNLSYKKGAVIIHMLRKELNNDRVFFNVLREFLIEFENKTASVDDFLNTLNRVTSNEYTWFFDQWYYGKGYPKISSTYIQIGDSVTIKLNQETTNSETPFFRMNLDVRMNNGDEYTDTTLVWTSNNQIFTLTNTQVLTSVTTDPLGNILAKKKDSKIDIKLNRE